MRTQEQTAEYARRQDALDFVYWLQARGLAALNQIAAADLEKEVDLWRAADDPARDHAKAAELIEEEAGLYKPRTLRSYAEEAIRGSESAEEAVSEAIGLYAMDNGDAVPASVGDGLRREIETLLAVEGE